MNFNRLTEVKTLAFFGIRIAQYKDHMKDIYQIILSDNHQMNQIRAIINEIANNDTAVLIKGEIGTGKELLAEAIHLKSQRKHKPFVKVDCPLNQNGALQIKIFELEENSFTGAHSPKQVKFEPLEEGTILLNNITEMDFPLQEKLMKVLQNSMFSHLGEDRIGMVYPRLIVTTTNRFEKSTMERYFYDGPFSRIIFININVPPLRDRKEQILPLLEYYFNFYKEKYGKETSPFSSKLINLFKAYAWPGNVRELKNMVKDIVINGEENSVLQTISERRSHVDKSLEFYESPPKNHSIEKKFFTLKEVKNQAVQDAEEEIIKNALQQTHWNRRHATKLLGISYNALLYKIRKYNLR